MNQTEATAAAALMEEARDLLLAGRLEEATAALDRSAAAGRATGDHDLESTSYRLAAHLSRLLGELDDARSRADMAVSAAAANSVESSQARLELSRTLLAAGDAKSAVGVFSDLADAPAASLDVESLLAIATSLLASGEPAAAAERFKEASTVCSETLGSDRLAHCVMVTGAAAMLKVGFTREAEAILTSVAVEARETSDLAALADVDLLQASVAIDRGDLHHALEKARSARLNARIAISPGAYLGSALAIARIEEALGSTARAYGSLVTGLATLSDLWGPRLARLAFEQALLDQRERWGEVTFIAAKSQYARSRGVPAE